MKTLTRVLHWADDEDRAVREVQHAAVEVAIGRDRVLVPPAVKPGQRRLFVPFCTATF